MSVFSFLFGKNKSTSVKKKTVEINTSDKEKMCLVQKDIENISKPLKGYPSASGLYPSEVVMLFYAHEFKVTETKYPYAFQMDYEVGFPKEVFEKLRVEGYIRPSYPWEVLDKLKLVDLKSIASEHNIKVSGKKSELIERIVKDIPNTELDKYNIDRYWILTEKGQQEKIQNAYIAYCLENHKYSLKEIGITFLKINELYHNNPNANIRDLIWGELNKLSISTYAQAHHNLDYQEYCNVLRAMSYFVEEEEKYLEALQLYCTYQYYRINIQAGLESIKRITSLGRLSDIDTIVSLFYMDSDIVPYEAEYMKDLIAKNNIDSKGLYNFLLEVFSKLPDEGYFENIDLIKFIIYNLSGNKESAEDLCLKATKNAQKKIKIR